MAMYVGNSLYINDVIDSVERNLWGLTCYGDFRVGEREIETPAKSKFQNIRAAFNAMEGCVGKLEDISRKLPKDKRVRTGFLAEEMDADPGEIFADLMQPHLDKLMELAEQIGDEVWDQILAFEEAIDAETAVISYAASVPMPPRDELVSRCSRLKESVDDSVEYSRDCDASDPKKPHFQAIADLANMLGWVVAPNAIKHVKEYHQVIDLECNNILSNFIQLDCDPLHSDYAEAIRVFTKELQEYVAEYHPAGLRWNYMKGAAPEGYKLKRKVKARKDAHPFLDWLEIIDGPLLEYVYLSELIGKPVFEQAKLMFNAYVKTYQLITRVANVEKKGDNANAIRMYVMPVMYEIAEVTAAADGVDRENQLYLHLKAVSDVAQVMSWIITTETTAAMHTTEMANASEKLLNRILQTNEGKSSFPFHKMWVESLKKLLQDMKVYVTIHHYKELAFDSKHREEDVPSLWREREQSTKIREMKSANRGKVRHWTPQMRYLWGTGVIMTPRRRPHGR